MTLADLFVIRSRSSVPPDTGIFTAPQSLAAFPLATSVVATIARAARTIGRTEFDSILVPLIAAFGLGCAMFVVTIHDRRSRPRGLQAWLTAIAVAFLNCLLLFVAALGIEKF